MSRLSTGVPKTVKRLLFIVSTCVATVAFVTLLVSGGCTRRSSVGPPASEDSREHQVDPGALAAYIDRLAARGFSGSVLVMQDGKTILQAGYGLADEASGTPVTDRTLFYLASVSKQFTASAIVNLVEQGRLRVADTVGDLFPHAPPDKAGITVHQLLTHTSGLVEYVGGVHDRVGRDEALRIILSEPLRFPPGTEYGYTNGAYALLAMIVEEVSGTPFAEYMHQEIFAPAGMAHTILLGERVPVGLSAAHGYTDGQDDGDFSTWSGAAWAHWGSGGVFSNLRDMARWERALADDGILSSASRELLFTPHVETRQMHYGYGWRVGETDYGGHILFHFGSEDVGVSAGIMRFTDAGTAIVVLSNRVADDVALASRTAVAIAHKVFEPGYEELPEYATGNSEEPAQDSG